MQGAMAKSVLWGVRRGLTGAFRIDGMSLAPRIDPQEAVRKGQNQHHCLGGEHESLGAAVRAGEHHGRSDRQPHTQQCSQGIHAKMVVAAHNLHAAVLTVHPYPGFLPLYEWVDVIGKTIRGQRGAVDKVGRGGEAKQNRQYLYNPRRNLAQGTMLATANVAHVRILSGFGSPAARWQNYRAFPIWSRVSRMRRTASWSTHS